MARSFSDVVEGLWSVNPMKVLAGVLLFYFVMTSGIVYDFINEPPAIGRITDPATGKARPQAFMPYRVNGQYIMEGLCGGFFYTLGGLGFILLDMAQNRKRDRTLRLISRALGLVLLVGSYLACTTFLRIKMPE